MKNDSLMPNGSDHFTTSETSYEPSTRINKKRGHQMSMDTSKQELFFNKKQVVESVNIGATSNAAPLSDPLWGDASSDHPKRQIGDGLFIPKHGRILNASGEKIPPTDSSGPNIKMKDFGYQLGNDLSFSLSMHHSLEDPLCLKNGVRRVKVKEVMISENRSPELVNSFYPGKRNEPMSEDDMSSLTYSALHGGPLLVNPPFNRTENYTFSLGHASSSASGKIDGSYILDNQYNNWVNTSMSNWYQTENGNFMSGCPVVNYSHENFFTIYSFFKSVNEAFHPSSSNSKKANTITSKTSHQDHPEAVGISPSINLCTENSTSLAMSDNYRNSEQTITSFQSSHNNTGESEFPGGLISSCAVLPFQCSGALGDGDSAGNPSLDVISVSTPEIDGAQKNRKHKATKIRTSKNNFPANVKSLLSTGILDGVPVKYVSWSREMMLRGVLNGNCFLCGCQECKLVKVVNAYEFESHAGCNTKHPNNHIYFENGKTIYVVVQELKNTPREMLFDAMQNMAGSLVNQKNFEIWKASYN